MGREFVRYGKSWDSSGIRNKLYGRKWQQARAAWLKASPWCVRCEAAGRQTRATVLDHIVPHRGDIERFWDRLNWQSMCAACHNGDKAREEIAGYSDKIGPDGWPLDPVHPVNSGIEPITGKARPEGLKPLAVDTVLLIGPPGAGKSTYCKAHMVDGDLLVDLDEIGTRLYGPVRQRWPLFTPLYRERNRMLLDAATRQSGRVFMPIGGARKEERDWWRKTLGRVIVICIATDVETCIERINADPTRKYVARDQAEAVKRWWKAVELDGCDEIIR